MARFSPGFLDELKARTTPSALIGRYVKLKKQGNEWAGLSPFTKEKTPSFFVNDQKGFYHCFSSGKHGDVITFLMETQKMTFPEAVASLAAEAGLELPAETPGEAAREEQRDSLADAGSAAAKFFAAMLRRTDGRRAASYLRERGVTDEQIEAFGLGFAPPGRAALKDALINKGFKEETLVEAGLLIKPEDGGESYDRFRNRIMFPIAGSRDRIIAFGGRALDPGAPAKYLNSPETPLFHKGSMLYNYGRARKAAGEEKTPLIVCEGYMDVIALWSAGVRTAVAPLGTALTESQLALLWRVSDEPILCFDGDKAGLGAAHRSIDRALPLLKPGKSLRFAFLPQGRDPDDLVRSEGAGAFDKVLENASPLVDVLWDRETGARPLDTPERRAALRSALRALAQRIDDRDVRSAYGSELAGRLQARFDSRPAPPPARRGPSRQGFRYVAPTRPTPGLKRRGAPTNWAREAALILAAVNHPPLVERQEGAFFDLELADSRLADLLSRILSALSAQPGLDSAGLKSHLSQTGAADCLERVLNDPELLKHRFLRPDAEIDEVESGFRNALDHHLFESTFKRDVVRAASAMFSDGDEGWKAAAVAREELLNSSKLHEASTEESGEETSRYEKALENWDATKRKKFNL
jgi:DNA primase